jgi:alkanesulfonate monooxygenase SsuD/methylene tetrahydromethanopterin reductase-like flavin-dependent oxidoreductase (luciferase family)
MRFAVSIPNVGSPADLVRLAADAEAAGWDGVFVWDHLQLDAGLRLDIVDPWVTLGAMATATSRVRLGTLVSAPARRRPHKLAKEVVTLDHLSAGRAVLGVGLGFPDHDEFGAFGDDPDARRRAAVTDEALALLDRLLQSEPVDHRGEHYQVSATLRPAPVQRPRPPIWVAAMAPFRRPLQRAARWDGVVPIDATGEPLTPEALRAYLAPLARPAGYEVVVARAEGATAAEYAAAGVTWLVDSTWPVGDWFGELRRRVLAGPQR